MAINNILYYDINYNIIYIVTRLMDRYIKPESNWGPEDANRIARSAAIIFGKERNGKKEMAILVPECKTGVCLVCYI
jgi:hypothetical protein